MSTFYFNTGVNPYKVSNFPYEYHRKNNHVINGTLLIPFDCDAPKNAQLMYLCDNSELESSKCDNIIVREVFNTTMCSKYAYFMVKNVTN